MLRNIAYYPIFGLPLIFYTGILTLTSFLITALLGYLVHKGKIPFKFHIAMVDTSMTLAFIHAIFGLSAYVNY